MFCLWWSELEVGTRKWFSFKCSESFIYVNTSVCEIEAVVKQSWRAGEPGERFPWIIFKLLLTENCKDTERMRDRRLGKLRPYASQCAVLHVFMYNSLIIWLCLKNRRIFGTHIVLLTARRQGPRQQWGPVACWRQTPPKKGSPNGRHLPAGPC